MAKIKTEAALGNREYKPSKSISMGGSKVPKETLDAWDKQYRDQLTERLKTFKPIQAKSIDEGFYATVVAFNNNLDKPEFFWSDEGISEMAIWTLRDLVVLLENGKELRK